MAEIIYHHDFVEVDYTGKLPDGTVFDTTEEAVAKKMGHFSKEAAYHPAAICVGELQILPGLDEQLEGKEVEKQYTITLPPEKAFGKRDIKKIRIVPSSTFREHKVEPQPGLQIEVDGELGTVMRVAGGRIIVNFNHPLAGREVQYEFMVRRKITEAKEQIAAFINTIFRIPEKQIVIDVQEGKASVKIPIAFPPQITEAIEKKIKELVKGINSVEIRTQEKA